MNGTRNSGVLEAHSGDVLSFAKVREAVHAGWRILFRFVLSVRVGFRALDGIGVL